MEQRYSMCSTVSGTRSHHCFILQSKSTLAMKRLSSDKEGAKVNLYNDDNVPSIRSHEQLHQNLQPGKYVTCLYHSVWYIGAVIERSDQNKDACIKFMKQVQVQVRFIIGRLDAIKDTLYIKIICKSKTKTTFFTTGDWKGPVTVI